MEAISVAKGQKFERWTVLREVERKNQKRQLLCVCECGTVKTLLLQSLRVGSSRSCGCIRVDRAVHGMWSSTEYTIWSQMKQRCYNPKNPNYHNYGARGIQVCERWRESFPAFLDDVGMRPSVAHSLDRFPNNNGNYEPGNVRWATISQQNLNKRAGRWERVVLLLAGDNAQRVRQMMDGQSSDEEISRYIAATFKPAAYAEAAE